MSAINPTRPKWVDDRLYPFTDRYVELDGHRIHYVDEGEGPVQLFVHPGPAWSFMFRHVILALRDRFRCVALDLPGWGLSTSAPAFRFTAAELAPVLVAFITRLDLQGVTIWAGDSSGAISLLAAETVPARIQGFVLNGTFAWSLETYPKVEGYLRLVTGRFFRSVNRRFNVMARLMGGFALGARKPSRAEARQYRKAFPTREGRDRPLDLLASLMDHQTLRGMERRLDRIRDRPALIVFGERDAAVKFGFYDRLQREFPNHEAHLIPRARHFAFEDAPEEVIRLFDAWWPRRVVASELSVVPGTNVPSLSSTA